MIEYLFSFWLGTSLFWLGKKHRERQVKNFLKNLDSKKLAENFFERVVFRVNGKEEFSETLKGIVLRSSIDFGDRIKAELLEIFLDD